MRCGQFEDQGDLVEAEAGAMMFMEDGIEMNTTLDPNKQGGGVMGKLFAGAKRVLSGDTFFVTTFMNAGRDRRRVGGGRQMQEGSSALGVVGGAVLGGLLGGRDG
jgi:hypothetical protein